MDDDINHETSAMLFVMILAAAGLAAIAFYLKVEKEWSALDARITNIEMSGISTAAKAAGSDYCALNGFGEVQRAYVMCPKEEGK